MKYKPYWKPAEAALYLAGLEDFRTVEEAQLTYESLTGDPVFDVAPIFSDRVERLIEREPPTSDLKHAIFEAIDLLTAMTQLLTLQNQKIAGYEAPRDSLTRIEISEYFESLGQIGSKYSKIMRGDLLPESLFKDRNSSIALSEKSVSTKTKNTYLKLINAMANCITDGSTGSAYKDAEAAVVAMELKLGESPVSARTLSNYLTEAREG